MSSTPTNDSSAAWRHLFGKPDGFFVRLRCRLLGHDWYMCEPECCNQWWCWRCETPGASLDDAEWVREELRKRHGHVPGEAAS